MWVSRGSGIGFAGALRVAGWTVVRALQAGPGSVLLQVSIVALWLPVFSVLVFIMLWLGFFALIVAAFLRARRISRRTFPRSTARAGWRL